jgi:hypothetical protein
LSVPVLQSAFVTGEVSPALFGHVDLARMKSAASTMRNLFCGYRGGAYSRAGTKFVGFSKQTNRSVAPRLIPFQFSINEGLALEFGNYYMRVISRGAFVTESPLAISAITRANPGVLSLATGIPSAFPNTASVSASYAPHDTVTLAGGVFTTAAVVTVDTTRIQSLALNSPGTAGYAPGDTINLAGGTQTVQSQVQVMTTKVVSATIAFIGSAIPNGLGQTAFVLGGTGSGAQLTVDIVGGHLVNISAVSAAGSYTVNPPGIAQVLIAGNVSAFVFLSMGVGSISLLNQGVFTANPGGGNFTQASTTGAGSGATFNTALMVPNDTHISTAGAYTVFPANPVAQAATSGTGVGVTFTIPPAPVINNGDWFYLANIGGMTQLNGETVVAAGVAGLSFNLTDVYGNNIDTSAFTAYTAGGTIARIYTLVTPYSENDLAFLKYTQSADVMSLCCVNQDTLIEYPPQDLRRFSDTNWTLTAVIPAPSVASPPGTPTVATSTAGNATFQFEITAVAADGTESIASNIGQVAAAVNIYSTEGTISVTWTAVTGVNEYNIYMASPGISTTPPPGSLFGYVGTAYGTEFINSNIIPDFSQVPPTHQNPFARGQVVSAQVGAGGAAYVDVGFTINSATGSGASLQGVISAGALVAIIVRDRGQNYLPADTVTVTSGTGAGATANLTIGALSGTYPGCVAYFQERRAYAYTLNNPDTYFMSQPGAFTNFDSRIPTIDSDAIIGSPWSVQVNGIQWMVPTSGGLLVFTGLQTWLLVGQGSFATNVGAVSPSNQVVSPQPEVGCSPILPPIKINYDVLFVDSNSSVYYDQPYQLYTLSEPIDITQNSPHLFAGFTMVSHVWCRRPYKLLWAVRDDGVLLSGTFYKAQEVNGWARHDTQGIFVSNCAVIEPPVDAQYLATQRYPGVHVAYMIERMDDRIWTDIEDTWAVDCGLELTQGTPAATLSASSATGLGAVTGASGLVGGSGYTAGTTVTIIDAPTSQNSGLGPGTGATAHATIVATVITAIVIDTAGSGYLNPQFVIEDTAGSAGGSGASATCVLSNAATFTATAAVFTNPGSVGSVIRMGGGIATITAVSSTTVVTANILSPIVELIPNTASPQPKVAGDWTLTAPVSTISGLRYLAGASVTGIADGNVISPRTVSATGTVTLDAAASAVTVGLAFTAQLQTTYLDAGQPTLQGQRKKISEVTARIEASRGVKVGSNQPDGSVQNPPQLAPTWANLTSMDDKAVRPYNALCQPLYTGDTRCPVTGGMATFGQVAFQQDNPLPLNVLAVISEVDPGDTPQTQWPKKHRGGEQ